MINYIEKIKTCDPKVIELIEQHIATLARDITGLTRKQPKRQFYFMNPKAVILSKKAKKQFLTQLLVTIDLIKKGDFTGNNQGFINDLANTLCQSQHSSLNAQKILQGNTAHIVENFLNTIASDADKTIFTIKAILKAVNELSSIPQSKYLP